MPVATGTTAHENGANPGLRRNERGYCIPAPFAPLVSTLDCRGREWLWDERLRFLGCARNHYGLIQAARGDENGALPVNWGLCLSSVPIPAPHRGYRVSPVRRGLGVSCVPTSAPHHGYRVSPVRRGWCSPGYFRTNHPCRLRPAPPGMKMGQRSPAPHPTGAHKRRPYKWVRRRGLFSYQWQVR